MSNTAGSSDTPRTVTTDSAYGGDEPSRQADGSSDWSPSFGTGDMGLYASAGHYMTYAAAAAAGYGMSPCSPVMHRRPINVDYAMHLNHIGQPCCCTAAPMPYGHPVGAPPFGPFNICHNNVEQHPTAPMMYAQHMLYGNPYVNANCCSHLSPTCQSQLFFHSHQQCATTTTVTTVDHNTAPIDSTSTIIGSTNYSAGDDDSPFIDRPTLNESSPATCLPSPKELPPTTMSVDSLNVVPNKAVPSETTPDVETECEKERPENLEESTDDVIARSDQNLNRPRQIYKASIRMDIPYNSDQTPTKEPPRRLIMQREQQRTTAFTIQFNDDKSAIVEKPRPLLRQKASAKRSPKMTKNVVAKEQQEKKSDNDDEDDAVSESGTYTVDDELSYVKNKQRFEQEGRNRLLKELMKISNGGTPQPTATALRCSKSGPSSPRNRRSVVGQCQQQTTITKMPPLSEAPSNFFQRGDGGRFSLRAKANTSPCRSVGNSPRTNVQHGSPSPETLAWLRRKEYNPLKGSSSKASTNANLLNSRSKSFHSGPNVATLPSSCPNHSSKVIRPGSSSLKGQVFVELGSLKKLQVLSVDLMTSASGLHQRHNRLLSIDENLTESVGHSPTVIDGDSSCPLSDIIKKLTIVDRALKLIHQSMDRLEMAKSTTQDDDQ